MRNNIAKFESYRLNSVSKIKSTNFHTYIHKNILVNIGKVYSFFYKQYQHSNYNSLLNLKSIQLT